MKIAITLTMALTIVLLITEVRMPGKPIKAGGSPTTQPGTTPPWWKMPKTQDQTTTPTTLQQGTVPDWVKQANQSYTTQQDVAKIKQANQPAALQTGNAPAWVKQVNKGVDEGRMRPAQPTGLQALLPAWLRPGIGRNVTGGQPTTKLPYNATPPGTVPTGSFLSAGGTLGLTPTGTIATNPAIFPTGSLLSGAGDVNTGIPYFPVLPGLDDQAGAGGGFGSSYGGNWGRRRYGYGGGGGYGYGGGYSPYDYTPAFNLGLNSWNYGE